MGGAVAQEFALNFPDRISSLVLLGTFAGGRRSVPMNPGAIAIFEQSLAIEALIERCRHALPATYSQRFLQHHENLALELELKGLRYTTEETLRWHGHAVGSFDAYDRLPSVGVRSLIVHGTDDPIMPIENGRILAARLVESVFVALEGAGHLPAVEQPLETADLIRRFAGSENVAGPVPQSGIDGDWSPAG